MFDHLETVAILVAESEHGRNARPAQHVVSLDPAGPQAGVGCVGVGGGQPNAGLDASQHAVPGALQGDRGPGRARWCHHDPALTVAIRFKAQLQARGPAAAVVLDDAQVTVIGEGAKRFPVAATINGYSWRTTVTRMGGEFLLGLNREVRREAGVEAGEQVDVTIELDEASRDVEVPEVLAAALTSDPQAKAAFERMAFTHRKEYARWIAEAKRQETTQRRVQQALEMIRSGKTRT